MQFLSFMLVNHAYNISHADLLILLSFFYMQIMDTLAEIQERHDAVRDLEKKLLDLQQV